MPENVNTLKFRSVHSLPLSLTPFPCSLVSPFGTRKVFEFSEKLHCIVIYYFNYSAAATTTKIGIACGQSGAKLTAQLGMGLTVLLYVLNINVFQV